MVSAASIGTILFDADGVLQRPSPQRRARWAEVLGPDKNVDDFLRELFAAEAPAHVGRGSFTASLAPLVARWGCQGSVEDVLEAWTMIEPDWQIFGTIEQLSRQGIRCHLASNQEPYRAEYMSVTLGYSRRFAREFYSCRLGVKKPDPDYFRAILGQIDMVAGQVLFIDDHEPNVEAARSVGLQAAPFTIEAGVEGLHRLLEGFGVRPGGSG